MSFKKSFANKIALSAKILVTLLVTCSIDGCQKKETPGNPPQFQLEWIGFSTQEKYGKLYVKRLGSAEENPKLQVRVPKGATERRTNRHAIIECDTKEIFNKVDPVDDGQLTYSLSKESMPLIKSLPRVSSCDMSLTIFNEEGSSHTENLSFNLIQDSEAPYEIIDETPPLPITASANFQLRNLRIKNTGELSQKFFVRNTLNYEVKKIFFFDPAPHGGSPTYRYSEDWVKALPFKALMNGIELPPNAEGFYVFELQPQQELRLILTSSLPGGSCAADTMGGARLGGSAYVPGFTPRHYKGALVRQYESNHALMQFETASSPLSDKVTSRRPLLDSTAQVGISGVPIETFAQPIKIVTNVFLSFMPVLDDCMGILPDRLR